MDRFRDYKEYADHGSPQAGMESFTIMPWLPFSQITEEDLKAIYAYLRTQKAIRHSVESHPGVEAPRQNIARSTY